MKDKIPPPPPPPPPQPPSSGWRPPEREPLDLVGYLIGLIVIAAVVAHLVGLI